MAEPHYLGSEVLLPLPGTVGAVDDHFFLRYRSLLDAEDAAFDELEHAYEDAFGPDGAAFFRPGPRGKPHLDVRAANVRQLEQAGLTPDHIHHVADCTMCRADLYHSYRREGKGAGRMINFGFSWLSPWSGRRSRERRSRRPSSLSAPAHPGRRAFAWI